MSTGSVTPEQLNFARDYLAGVYPIQSETAEQVSDRVLTAAAFGLPPDYNRTYPDKFARHTRSSDAMAKQYLATTDFDHRAGRKRLRVPRRAQEGLPGREVRRNFVRPDGRAGSRSAQAEGAAAEATPESLEQGKQILLAAANAAGGDALTSVKTLTMTEKGKQTTPNGDVPLNVKWTVAYPDHLARRRFLRGQASRADMRRQVGLDRHGWQTHDVTPVIGEFERGIALFGGGWGFYQEVLAGKITGKRSAKTEIDGKKTLGVAVQGAIRQRETLLRSCHATSCRGPLPIHAPAGPGGQRTALERLPRRWRAARSLLPPSLIATARNSSNPALKT